MADSQTLREWLKPYFKRDNKGRKQMQRLNLQVVVRDAELLWLESEKQIIISKTAIPALQHVDTNMSKPFCQKLICSQPIEFEVLFMEMSVSNKFVALVGLNRVAIVEIPHFCLNTSFFADDQSDVNCRTILVGEDLFNQQLDLEILSLQWFTGSPNDSHIILLTNDNCLRCFDIAKCKQPLNTISLSDYHNPSRLHISVNFALAYSEVAVSFSIGPPVIGKNEIVLYPIFVLQEDGNVLIIWSWLDLQKIFWVRQGPLRILPESDDTYQWNFCSILCLKTSPTVIVLATKCGIHFHCIVLDDEDEKPRTELQDKLAECPVAKLVFLYIYDHVELEKASIQSSDSGNHEETIKSAISLVEDRSDVSCYFTISPAGVHMINLQWINEITELASSNLDFRAPTDVCFLLSTQPTERSYSPAIIGFSVVNHTHNDKVLLCLLDTGEIVTRIIRKSYGIDDSNDANDSPSQSVMHDLSPTKTLVHPGSFEKCIKKILHRNKSSSIIKSVHHEPSRKDFYQLLVGATNCMREEYIKRQTNARFEISKRCKILKKLNSTQMRAMTELVEDRTLFDNAEAIAEKLFTVSDSILSITDRLNSIKFFMHACSPVISDSEQEWKAEVETMQNKLIQFKRNMEQLKQKKEILNFCKFGACNTSSNDGKLHHHKFQHTPRNTKSNDSILTSSQQLKVKAKLKEQNNRIGELLETVKALHSKI